MLQSQFYIQLVFKATYSFFYTHIQTIFNVEPKKHIPILFKDIIYIFVTFMFIDFIGWMLQRTDILLMDLFAFENMKNKTLKIRLRTLGSG